MHFDNSLIYLQTYVNDERVQGEQGVWLQSYDQLKCGRGKEYGVMLCIL